MASSAKQQRNLSISKLARIIAAITITLVAIIAASYGMASKSMAWQAAGAWRASAAISTYGVGNNQQRRENNGGRRAGM